LPLQTTDMVEAGDILVSFHPSIRADDPMAVLLEGMTHARLVFKTKDGTLGHLEAPYRFSSAKDLPRNAAFHILRLRKYPKELGPSFNGHPSSAAEASLVEEWQRKRENALKYVNEPGRV